MNEKPAASLPRILIVEDDPVSATYLADVVASLPAEVDVAGNVAEAMALAGAHQHALLLIDAHLPDGLGESLLQVVRARGVTAPALAHTAAREAALRERLLASGFAEVLRKPLGITELKLALQRHLSRAAPEPVAATELARWDEAAALAALGGQRTIVDALRGLLVEELRTQRHRIARACMEGNETGVRDELHRLVASCGFVGAARLGQLVRQMQATPLNHDSLAALQSGIDEVLTSTRTNSG